MNWGDDQLQFNSSSFDQTHRRTGQYRLATGRCWISEIRLTVLAPLSWRLFSPSNFKFLRRRRSSVRVILVSRFQISSTSHSKETVLPKLRSSICCPQICLMLGYFRRFESFKTFEIESGQENLPRIAPNASVWVLTKIHGAIMANSRTSVDSTAFLTGPTRLRPLVYGPLVFKIRKLTQETLSRSVLHRPTVSGLQ